MALSTIERVLVAREAGNVRRCHVVPHHGEYTVGKHSYDAVSMLLVMHPDPSIHLIKALLWHDGAERWVGDMPAPAKLYNEELGQAYAQAEWFAMRAWELYDAFEFLTEDDLLWLRTIDSLELWAWCQDQLALGNQHIREFIRNLEEYFEHESTLMPEPCWRFYKEFKWTRLPDIKEWRTSNGGE